MKLRLTLAAMVAILLTAARHSRAGLAAIQPYCYTASSNGQSYYLPV